jgi:hypothetical protein
MEESKLYHLYDANCFFFCSVVLQLICERHRHEWLKGNFPRPKLGEQVRIRIKAKFDVNCPPSKQRLLPWYDYYSWFIAVPDQAVSLSGNGIDMAETSDLHRPQLAFPQSQSSYPPALYAYLQSHLPPQSLHSYYYYPRYPPPFQATGRKSLRFGDEDR